MYFYVFSSTPGVMLVLKINLIASTPSPSILTLHNLERDVKRKKGNPFTNNMVVIYSNTCAAT